MKIESNLFPKLLSITTILLIISTIVFANNDGGKNKKSDKTPKEQVNKNTKEDIGQQVQMKYSETASPGYEESEEDRANWYISQSLPKPEKVSKKEETEQEKINRKIIKKERKECKKLQKSIKKGDVQTKLPD
jgi:hypothetical protein